MKLLNLLLCCSVWVCFKPVYSQQVYIIEWASDFASPPLQNLAEDQQPLVDVARAFVGQMSEGQMIGLGGIAAAAMGVEDQAAIDLQTKLAAYYRRIDADPLFKGLPSLLSYSFSSTRPLVGKATLYQPENINEQTRTIVFLHGFGGSFHFYLHYMISCFPNDIIICPVYGLSPFQIEHQYVQEAIQVGRQKIGSKVEPKQKPILICLSAGGYGGFRLVSQFPKDYPKLVVMGAGPPDDLPNLIQSEVRLLVGGEEAFYKYGNLRGRLKQTIARGKVKGHAIKGANHFFMLTHKQETRQILQRWINSEN